MMNNTTLQNNLSLLFWSGTSRNLLSTIVILGCLWSIYFVLRFIIKQSFRNLKRRYAWRSRSFYFVLFLSIYFVGKIWLSSVDDLLTFFGIIAATLTLTQKESLMNLTGCALIHWRELFRTGDRLQIGTHCGEVTATGIFYFHMLECDPKHSGDQTTGRIIKVPNGLVITTPIINYSELFPFTWQELTVILTPDSDLQNTRAVLTELVHEEIKHHYDESQEYLNKYGHYNFISELQLKTQSFVKLHQNTPGGFLITVRYLALSKQQDELQGRVLEKFLYYLKATKVGAVAFQ